MTFPIAFTNAGYRQTKTNLSTLTRFLSDAGVALPASVAELLAAPPAHAESISFDPQELARAVAAAKDPLTDKAVLKQLTALQLQDVDIAGHLDHAHKRKCWDAVVAHAPELLASLSAAVAEQAPLIQEAVDHGIDDLQTVNVAHLAPRAMEAYLYARVADKKVRAAYDAYRHILSHALRRPRLAAKNLLIIADASTEDHDAKLRTLARGIGADKTPWGVANAGMRLHLPATVAELEQRIRDLDEAVKEAHERRRLAEKGTAYL